MPTPREILLARHRAVEPQLDAMRADVLASLEAPVSRGTASLPDMLRTVWRELVAPCRPAWMTLAAVWVVLLLVNGAGRSAGTEVAPASQETVAAVARWLEKRRMWAELTTPPVPVAPEMRAPGHSQLSPAGTRTRDAC